VNPRDEASLLRVVNVPRRGIGDTTLHQAHELCRTRSVSLVDALGELIKQGGLAANTDHGIKQFLALVARFRREFRECGGDLSKPTSELVEALQYRGELYRTCKSKEQFEAKWSNVSALLQAVETYQANQREAGAPATLSKFLDQSALASDDDRSRDKKDNRRENAVTLMTIHSAKGLEFPFVFIVGCEDGILPHEKSVGEKAIEEERRLFYVALTRGKRHVTLFETVARNRFGRQRLSKTSRFVAEIPQDLLRQHIRAARDMAEQALAKPKPRPKKPRAKRKPQMPK